MGTSAPRCWAPVAAAVARLVPVLSLVLVGCNVSGTGRGPVWIDRTGRAMDSKLIMAIEAPDRPSAVLASEAVLSAVGAADALLSPNRPDSKVTELNAEAVGVTAPVDSALCRVLQEVEGLAQEVPGAFDPVIGSLVDAWDLDGDGRVPSVVELEAARRAVGTGGMILDTQRCTVQRLADGASYLPWGFVNGYALRSARDSLFAHGVRAARLSFGDQVVVLGSARHGGPWRVPIPSLEDGQAEVFTLWLVSGTASIASQSNRFVRAAGQTVGHILDPRTGTPVPGWGSLTVVSQDPLEADVLSTALFVLGPDSAYAWAERHPEVGVLILDRRDGAVRFRWSDALRPALDSATATPVR